MKSPAVNSTENDVSIGNRPRKGLNIDYLLRVINTLGRDYHLPSGILSLDQMERDYPALKTLIANFLRQTTELKSGVWAFEHPLLSGLQDVEDSVNRGGRSLIPTEAVPHNLRRVLEAVLHTLTRLPDKDQLSDYGAKTMKSLTLQLRKVAGEMNSALGTANVRNRLSARNPPPDDGPERFARVGVEMLWAAKTLEDARLHTKPRKLDKPKPQIRFALYFVTWMEGCTGKKQYEFAQLLMTAAFATASKTVPKWIDRLALEMYDKRKIRMAWAESITVSEISNG